MSRSARCASCTDPPQKHPQHIGGAPSMPIDFAQAADRSARSGGGFRPHAFWQFGEAQKALSK